LGVGQAALLTVRDNVALLLGILSSVLTFAFLFRYNMIASEAPTYAKVVGYGVGYRLWLTSAGLMIVSGATGPLKQMQGRL
jgi:hypothetical protein